MADVFTRPDTFFGVCEAIGEDLGINPIWLRIALGVAVVWQPVWVICGYFALGAVVLALRLLMPNRAAPAAEAPLPVAAEGANDAAPVPLAQAA